LLGVIPLYDRNKTLRFPLITVTLIAINVVVYFFVQPHRDEIGLGMSSDTSAEFLYRHAAVPCEVLSGRPVEVSGPQIGCDLPRGGTTPFPHKNVYLALVVSMFLHANLLHIGGNMLFLWIFGNNVEDEMGAIPFLLFYFACGIIATFAFVIVFPSSATPLLGASGAIAGVLGAYLVRFPRARVVTWIPFLIFLVVPLPAWLVLGVWFVGQFGLGAANEGIATAAHIGGFIAGALIALIALGRRPRRDVSGRPPPYPPPGTPYWVIPRYPEPYGHPSGHP
jgi:membrane associated rhomboid family serine protease